MLSDFIVNTQLGREFNERIDDAAAAIANALAAAAETARREQVELLADVKEVLELCDPEGRAAKSIIAPEDPMIKQLCERIGYGAVISSASRQWWLKDPIGAYTAGPCAGTVSHMIQKIDAALTSASPAAPAPDVAAKG